MMDLLWFHRPPEKEYLDPAVLRDLRIPEFLERVIYENSWRRSVLDSLMRPPREGTVIRQRDDILEAMLADRDVHGFVLTFYNHLERLADMARQAEKGQEPERQALFFFTLIRAYLNFIREMAAMSRTVSGLAGAAGLREIRERLTRATGDEAFCRKEQKTAELEAALEIIRKQTLGIRTDKGIRGGFILLAPQGQASGGQERLTERIGRFCEALEIPVLSGNGGSQGYPGVGTGDLGTGRSAYDAGDPYYRPGGSIPQAGGRNRRGMLPVR